MWKLNSSKVNILYYFWSNVYALVAQVLHWLQLFWNGHFMLLAITMRKCRVNFVCLCLSKELLNIGKFINNNHWLLEVDWLSYLQLRFTVKLVWFGIMGICSPDVWPTFCTAWCDNCILLASRIFQPVEELGWIWENVAFLSGLLTFYDTSFVAVKSSQVLNTLLKSCVVAFEFFFPLPLEGTAWHQNQGCPETAQPKV